ncbi:hypothetical protein ACFLSI_02965 [Bacteroidota bacterium]
MKRLLKIELQKVLSFNLFRVLVAMYLGIFFLCIITFPHIEFNLNFNDEVDMLDIKSFYSFPIIWNSYAWLASKFNIFLAIMIIFLIGNEFSFRTFRQHIIDGLSKKEIIYGKLLVIFLISIGSFLVIFISSLIMGLIYSDDYSFSLMFENIPILFIYLLQACAYMSMAMFIAIFIRNKTVSIVVFLIYSMIVEPSVRFLLGKYVLSDLMHYFPAKVIFKLTPLPENALISFVKVNAESEGFIGPGIPLYLNILLAVFYASIFIFFSYRIIKKRDI